MDSDEWFPLEELTGRLGGLVWVESQLQEILTGWSRIESAPAMAVMFASAAGHHGWHAEIVRQSLATSPALRAEQAVVAPTRGWQNAVATLASLTDPDGTAARLKAIVRVVDPWLQREVGSLTELCRPVSDAGTLRWLRFVSLDHHDDAEAIARALASRPNDAVGLDEHRLLSGLDLT